MQIALSPCRSCGEAQYASIDPGAYEVTWPLDDQGRVIRTATGEPSDNPKHLHVDGVCCGRCDVLMPLRLWNATASYLQTMRASIAEADAEYDDDGVWHGLRRGAA